MTAPITTLRSTIATALADPTNTKWQTFSYVPATILPYSVIVAYGTPMLETTNNQWATAPLANFKILMTVPIMDNQGNLAQLEEIVTDVFNLLSASSLNVTVRSIGEPMTMDLESGSLLTSEMNISLMTAWS